MTDAGRRPLVVGNWKMNPPARAAAEGLAREVAASTTSDDAEVVICPPAIWLTDVAKAVEGTHLGVGAQNMDAREEGAVTGEISPLMLAGIAGYVIVGHSERRRLFGETDAAVAAKVASAVTHGLVPIVAVGESAEERRAGETDRVIERQVRAAVSGLDQLAGSGLVVAYEPVWAVGTGEMASGTDAQAGAALIRGVLAFRRRRRRRRGPHPLRRQRGARPGVQLLRAAGYRRSPGRRGVARRGDIRGHRPRCGTLSGRP